MPTKKPKINKKAILAAYKFAKKEGGVPSHFWVTERCLKQLIKDAKKAKDK